MTKIQSKLHKIGTYDFCKTSLSCFDDERYILDHDINSLADFDKDVRSRISIESIEININRISKIDKIKSVKDCVYKEHSFRHLVLYFSSIVIEGVRTELTIF